LQLECFEREGKEFSRDMTAEKRAESLGMSERGVVANKGEFLMVVEMSIGELVILFVSMLLTD